MRQVLKSCAGNELVEPRTAAGTVSVLVLLRYYGMRIGAAVTAGDRHTGSGHLRAARRAGSQRELGWTVARHADAALGTSPQAS